ncbi:unnamed protein product [Camellia sinensis]
MYQSFISTHPWLPHFFLSLPTNLNLFISNLSSFITVKLDSTNFIIWRSQFQNILRATKLLDFTNGSVPCPPLMIKNSSDEEILNPDREKWNVIDAHLLSCTTTTLAPAIFTSVLHFQLSEEVWDTLCKRFTLLFRSHIHQMKNRLNNLTKESKSNEDYLSQIKELVDKLALASSPADEKDLVLLTLNGLPDEFDALRTAIHTRTAAISMAELSSLLCSESIHIESKQKKNQNLVSSVAYAATKGSKSSYHGSSSSRGRLVHNYRGTS